MLNVIQQWLGYKNREYKFYLLHCQLWEFEFSVKRSKQYRSINVWHFHSKPSTEPWPYVFVIYFPGKSCIFAAVKIARHHVASSTLADVYASVGRSCEMPGSCPRMRIRSDRVHFPWLLLPPATPRWCTYTLTFRLVVSQHRHADTWSIGPDLRRWTLLSKPTMHCNLQRVVQIFLRLTFFCFLNF